MTSFNRPSKGQLQSGSASPSTYSNRITCLYPRLQTTSETPPTPSTIEPATIETASPRATHGLRSESPTPTATHPEAATPPPTPRKPLNPPPSAIEATALKLAQISAKPGEFWLVDRDGWDPWPAIICDESMVSQFFKKRWQHRVNSQRSNGTWGKKFTEHGELVGKRTFPALLLALNTWWVGLPSSEFGADLRSCWVSVWVPCHRLLPLDLQMAARRGDVRGKRKLGLAYKLAAEKKPLRVWEDVLIVHRRRTQNGTGAVATRSVEVVARGRQCSRGTGSGGGSGVGSEVAFKFPPGFVGGEEPEGSGTLFLSTPPPSSGRKNAKWAFESPVNGSGGRSGGEGELPFKFPAGFVDGEETEGSGGLSLLTPQSSVRKTMKREFEDEMSGADLKALYEDSDADEVRVRRSRRAKKIRQDQGPTQGPLGRREPRGLGEVEVVVID